MNLVGCTDNGDYLPSSIRSDSSNWRFFGKHWTGKFIDEADYLGWAVEDGLRDLKAHGIDYRLLFPDLLGAAKQANVQRDVF